MSEKHKKTCKYLNYAKHLLILASIITGYILISSIASLDCIPVGIASSARGIKLVISQQESKSISQL